MEDLCEALQATVQRWRGRFPSPLPLELYTSSNFIGLFVEEQVADVLKQFAADFAAEATRKAGTRRGSVKTGVGDQSESPSWDRRRHLLRSLLRFRHASQSSAAALALVLTP